MVKNLQWLTDSFVYPFPNKKILNCPDPIINELIKADNTQIYLDSNNFLDF